MVSQTLPFTLKAINHSNSFNLHRSERQEQICKLNVRSLIFLGHLLAENFEAVSSRKQKEMGMSFPVNG